MKTTIYELLGMIKDGNIPQKIIFGDYLYTYNKSRNDYETFIDKFEREYLFDEYIVFDILNKPVEILETTITYKPDKIEKLEDSYTFVLDSGEVITRSFTMAECIMKNKINEIIEAINER